MYKLSIKEVISDIVSLLFKSDKKENIEEALQLLINSFEVDWVYVAAIDQEQEEVHILYDIASIWGNKKTNGAPLFSYKELPWMIGTILTGKDFILNDIDELPPSAYKEKELYETQGLQSLLAIPLSFNGQISGLIGFDSIHKKREWSLAEVQDLHIIANIFSVILERQHQQLLIQEEKRRNLEEINRIKETDQLKTTFISNMSHEIRTPLNAIVGFSSIMAETEDPQERKHYQQIVDKNNKMLLQLIADMIDFSDIEAGTFEYEYANINLKELCKEIVTQTISNPLSAVPFIFHLERHPDIMLYSDRERVKQVITNLISNAYKFTRSGSIVLSYRKVENMVRISVSDTGMGIPFELHNKVFDRFMKADSFTQGSGLGLSICKTIVNDLHGQIGLNSLSGKGSTFWFTLPLFTNSSDLYKGAI